MDSSNSGPSGTSGVKIVTRKYLFEKLDDQNLPSINEKLEFMENDLLSSYCDTEESRQILKHKFSYFKTNIKQRWSKAHNMKETFLKNNDSWLEGTFEIPISAQNRPGRPSKLFCESSERSKRRKTEEIRSIAEEDAIIHAAQVILQKRGQRNAAHILKDITNSAANANKYKVGISEIKVDTAPLTPQQALLMFVEADLTKRQYEIVRATNKSFYPCYDLILKAKQECYPPKELISITATSAESNLQCLIDITVKRLSLYLEEVLETLTDAERHTLHIICKWGCDGSQQAQFKQIFSNDLDSDANLFISSFVPLKIVCGEEKNKVVWQNPTPSSPRYCRPIRFRFVKESRDVIKEEISYVEESVNSLSITEVNLKGKIFIFKHIFKMTMVDGKVCNAATDTTSTSKCYICGATSKTFNDLTKKNELSLETLEFGISVLHARIRIFESVLHLAYKLPVKKYRKPKTDEEKAIEEKRKREIQERFRLETGLLVDFPKSNFGNSNDGNTSRRFFANPELAAEITGISYELIFRLKIILEALSSGHAIDVSKYDQYALETAKLYVELYGWHPMTPTMHKVLIHGGAIIEHALLPIGQLSEEAAEARNKHFRSYRQNYARKFSREVCNEDIYNRLLLSSDPLMSSMKKTKKASIKAFSPEAIDLLIPAQPNEDE